MLICVLLLEQKIYVVPNFVTKDAVFSYAQCCNIIVDASTPSGYSKFRIDGTAPAQSHLKQGQRNEEVDTYFVGPRRFTGEPLVIPKKGGNIDREEDAYLVGLVYDSVEDRSSLVVFDLERELKEGPVCTVWLKTALPHGLHGCWSPDDTARTSSFC